MNILLIIPSLEKAGAERVMANLSNLLAKKHNIYLLTWQNSPPSYKFSGQHLSINISGTDNSTTFQKIVHSIKRWKIIKKVKKKYAIDLSISFLEQANIINVLSYIGEPQIISIRSYMFGMTSLTILPIWIEQIIKTRLYNKASKVVFPSRQLNHLYKEANPKLKNNLTIENGYESNLIQEKANESLPQRFEKLFESEVFITTGLLKIDKGPYHLIRSVRPILKSIPNVKFIVIGKITSMKSELKSYSSQMGISTWWNDDQADTEEVPLDRNIYYLGQQENPFAFMNKSTLFIFPSIYEGFPNTLVEAIICGLPIVASDCLAGSREIIAPDIDLDQEISKSEIGKHGIITPKFEVLKPPLKSKLSPAEQEFCKSISQLAQNKNLQNEFKKNSKSVAGRLSMNLFEKRWNELIETCLS